MIEALCTNIFRDKDGSITYIRLVDQYNNYLDVKPRDLRRAVRSGQIHIPNLEINKRGTIRFSSF